MTRTKDRLFKRADLVDLRIDSSSQDLTGYGSQERVLKQDSSGKSH